MKKSNWLFSIMLIISVMITLSANNWISMWMGLELNMMSFIPLILEKTNKSSSEAAMIYFLVQSVSSILLIMMVMINMIKYLIPKEVINLLMTIAILIKLGAAPFHMWMPEMMSKMEWMKCSILMTWQKIAPLMMISNMNNTTIISLSIIWSVVIGSIGGINQSSLRKMMGFSSINHLGWMLAINKSMNLWMLYLTIYSVMIVSISYMFMSYKMYFINQVSSLNLSNTEKMTLMMSMMSMGGLPPFIGFLPKWITIQSMINSKEYLIILIMVMFSLITLMYYLRVMTNMYLSFNSTIKWFTINSNKMMTMIMITVNLSLPLMMMMDMYIM
uniref:NADH-ubiquinone oxidoreductase chain 2 n=1 Tax=Graphosoma rubrolineatum TaxID=295705 RepID=A0A1P8CZY9_GRARU|nr:NADH dehydrogenase subunit 2 [Graphosoma rubrolineatum]API85469.1 NADH dehydrogenase subunit 2 [Graphosoma rubrolineatum]